MAKYEYMTQGDPPWSLFRFASDDSRAWYLKNGEWVEDNGLLSYRQDDPCGADHVTVDEAGKVARAMGKPTAIVADAVEPWRCGRCATENPDESPICNGCGLPVEASVWRS